jgi:DNA-binding beta-propeller fold protein YncE
VGVAAVGTGAAKAALGADPKAGTTAEGLNLPYAFKPVGESISFGKDSPLGVAFDAKGNLYVAVAKSVRVFDPQGKELRTITLSDQARCVAVDDEGMVYVGLKTSLAKFDASGQSVLTWGTEGREAGQLQYVTGLAVDNKRSALFVCDAGNRKVHYYSLNGDYVESHGGFTIPSPYFDCALDNQGRLWVANTAEHRLERYDSDWKRQEQWGEYGTAPHQFSGCCNPTNFAFCVDGICVTTEKGIPRLKAYDGSGKLLAFLGPDAFSAGVAGLDVAVDATGRIAVVEPKANQVRFYRLEPSAGKGAKG